MKTKMFFRLIIIASLLMLGASKTFAQWDATGTPDTIATGSSAQYQVTLYYNTVVNLPAIYNNSGIIWTPPAGYTLAANFKQSDGVTALTYGADLACNQNSVVMIAQGVAGPLTLKAQELSRPIVGPSGCLGNTNSQTIQVVAMPTISAFEADSGACATPATLDISAKFNGYGKYDVKLNVAAFSLAAAPIGVNQTVQIVNMDNAVTTDANVTHWMPISNATLLAAAGGAIPAGGCYFTISVTDLQDRISKKDLNYVFTTTEVANANPAGGLVYHFYNYAAPVTQPIQHITNTL